MHTICPTSLTEAQLTDFRESGYLAFHDVLSAEEVDQARAELSRLFMEVWRHRPADQKSRSVAHASGMMIQLEPAANLFTLQDADVELAVRKCMWQTKASDLFQRMALSHPRISGVLNSLLGMDPILFQDMALVKPPRIGSEKPWHQDNAYFSVKPLDQVIGVWIALDPATEETGCMRVERGGHRRGALLHYHDRDCEILPDRMKGDQGHPVELPPGGGMFFVGMLPHRTAPNTSEHRRRALQFHYRGAQTEIVDPETYNRIYCEPDGTPASCQAAPPVGRPAKAK